MYRGVSQLPDTREMKQRRWDVSSDAQREKYTAAMEQWKKDSPFCAGIMADCIGDPKLR